MFAGEAGQRSWHRLDGCYGSDSEILGPSVSSPLHPQERT